MIPTVGSIWLLNAGTLSANMAHKDFWDKGLPKDHETKHLSRKQEQQAKARARAAGRPYPNLVDNAAVARKGRD